MGLHPDDFSERFALKLLEIGAVSLSPAEPYTWASGLKSPVYCDNRLIMGYPEIRNMAAIGFQDVIAREQIACDVVGGTATAGIPHAAWLAHRMGLPMMYVRSSAKAHGKGKQVEGTLNAGQRVVVIEDLVSTGMSSTAVLGPIEDTGAVVSAVLAIFTYGLEAAEEAFKAVEVPLYTLTNFPDLIEVASRTDRISRQDLVSLRLWHSDPKAWSSQFTG
jgi:orotate phosphoribosyltransferase